MSFRSSFHRFLSNSIVSLLAGVMLNLFTGWAAIPKQPFQEEEKAISSADLRKESSRRERPEQTKDRQADVQSNLLSRQLALAFSHPKVGTELELVDYQREQLRDLFYDYQKTLSELGQRYARMKPEERTQLFGELNQKVDTELARILLPPQLQRLQQLSLQSLVPSPTDGLAPFLAVLANPGYREHLGISADAYQDLQARLREENRKFAEEVQRLREAALERVLQGLSKEERQSLEEGLGVPFDFGGYQLGRGGVFRRPDDK